MEDEYEPNVRVIREPIQTTRVDLVHQRQPGSRIFHEPWLSRRAEFLSVNRFQETDWPDNEGSLVLLFFVLKAVKLRSRMPFLLYLFSLDCYLYAICKLWLRVVQENINKRVEVCEILDLRVNKGLLLPQIGILITQIEVESLGN